MASFLHLLLQNRMVSQSSLSLKLSIVERFILHRAHFLSSLFIIDSTSIHLNVREQHKHHNSMKRAADKYKDVEDLVHPKIFSRFYF